MPDNSNKSVGDTRPGQPLSSRWINKVKDAAFRGGGFFDSPDEAHSRPPVTRRIFFCKPKTVFSAGVLSTPDNKVTRVASPATGTVREYGEETVHYAFVNIPADTMCIAEEIDGYMHVAPLQCIEPEV